MTGAKSNIPRDRPHADREASEGRPPRRRRHLRQVRVPEPGWPMKDRGEHHRRRRAPGLLDRAGPSSRRPAATPPGACPGGGAAGPPACSSCRTRCRRRRCRPSLRRPRGDPPDRRRARGPPQLLPDRQADRAGDAGAVLREPVPQPGQPRGPLPVDGAGDPGRRAARSTCSSPAWGRAARSRAAAAFQGEEAGVPLAGSTPSVALLRVREDCRPAPSPTTWRGSGRTSCRAR